MSRSATPTRKFGEPRLWIRRRRLFLDPGYLRLSAASRTVGAVSVAIGLSVWIAHTFGSNMGTAGVFAGMIAMYAGSSSAGWGSGWKRSAGIAAVIPVAAGIVAGAYVPHDPTWTIFLLATVAAFAAWTGRFGARIGALGQLTFITFYFANLLGENTADLASALLSALIGVACAWISNLFPTPSEARQIRGGLRAVAERGASLLAIAVEMHQNGADREARMKQLRTLTIALGRSTSFLAGAVGLEPPAGGPAPEHTSALRLHVVDVELAADRLVSLLTEPAAFIDTHTHSAAQSQNVQEATSELEDAIARLTGEGEKFLRTLTRSRRTTRGTDSASHAAHDSPTQPPTYGPTRSPIRSPITVQARRDADRRAVQAAVATGLALFLGSFVSMSHQLWAAMPAFQTLRGSRGQTRMSSLQRILGTVFGAVAAFGLMLGTNHNLIVAFIVLAVTVFFIAFLRTVASAWTGFFQTMLMATMYDVLGKLNAQSIDVRLVETVIGATVAIVVSMVILPTRTRSRLMGKMAAVVATARDIVGTVLTHRLQLSGAEAQASNTEDAEATMGQQLGAVRAFAAPMRHSPGSMRAGGVQEQLAWLSALTYYVRQFARNADGIMAAGSGLQKWQDLDAESREHFESLLLALGGVPAPAPPSAGTDTAANSKQMHDPEDADRNTSALVDLMRINQSLVAFTTAISQDSPRGRWGKKRSTQRTTSLASIHAPNP